MHGIAPHGDCVQFLFQMSKNFNDRFLCDKIAYQKCCLPCTIYWIFVLRQSHLGYTNRFESAFEIFAIFCIRIFAV